MPGSTREAPAPQHHGAPQPCQRTASPRAILPCTARDFSRSIYRDVRAAYRLQGDVTSSQRASERQLSGVGETFVFSLSSARGIDAA
jgi:hypothetical protein